MNNCQRIAQVFTEANKCTMTREELESALRQRFPRIKHFMIPDHYENGKRDLAGNPIGGVRGRGSSCTYKPKGCIEFVAETYRLAACDHECPIAPGDIHDEFAPIGGPSVVESVSTGMSDPLGDLIGTLSTSGTMRPASNSMLDPSISQE